MNTTYGVLNNSSLIVDTDKLRENVRTILRSLPAGTKLIPVVKDDAYGMGMVGVARTLSAFPEIGCFAVANVSEGVTLRREGKLPSELAIATFGDNELLDFLQCPVLAVAQRHRDVAERVLEIVLASLDEPRKPKPGLSRIRRNLYRRGSLNRR